MVANIGLKPTLTLHTIPVTKYSAHCIKNNAHTKYVNLKLHTAHCKQLIADTKV